MIRTRCVLLGSGSLPVECAGILEAAGHEVVAMITRDDQLARWAQERGLGVHDPHEAGLAEHLQALAPDYLFSVVNLELTPSEVLATARRAAINFHDGPLPEYAGINTPAWAIMDGAREYGVTWHLMTAEVDQGDILQQRRFPIADDETSLSLNARCYQQAIASFKDLVDQISMDSLVPRAQGNGERAYFGKFKRPPAAGLLRWDESAETLSALVRALSFGEYPNPLGIAKVRTAAGTWCVRSVSVGQPSTAAPGTVTAVTEDHVAVATATSDLLIGDFAALDGTSVSVTTLVESGAFEVGAVLPVLTDEEVVAADSAAAAVARLEARNVEHLASLRPLALPGARVPSGEHATVEVEGNEARDAEQALAEALMVLGRYGRQATFDVRLRESSTGAQPSDIVVEDAVLRVDLTDAVLDLGALRDGVERAVKLARRQGRFAADLGARYPSLRSAAGLNALRVLVDLSGAPLEGDRLAGYDLVVSVLPSGAVRWTYDCGVMQDGVTAELREDLVALRRLVRSEAATPWGTVQLPSESARLQARESLNHTDTEYERDARVHELIERQARTTPDAEAVVCGSVRLTYRELDERSNRLARHLLSVGMAPGGLVGVHLQRSAEMLVSLVAIHKAGGAYVPLDPEYPAERIAYMLNHSGARFVVTESALQSQIPAGVTTVSVDSDAEAIAQADATSPAVAGSSRDLAYVMYTSGSTGLPKGVMIEHRNVVNFFVGMDERVEHSTPGAWLAVTSMSFDISVLELFWTLSRGFKVVVHTQDDVTADADTEAPVSALEAGGTPLAFSLFYFGSEAGETEDPYRLLMEGARFADAHGFSAVWTPERHFHAFGGLFPNPSVTAAAVASVTKHVAVRAGSVVLPLHHVARVAEEWAVVDRLSNGRAGIACASGWRPDDFVLQPQNYAGAKTSLGPTIGTLRRLWKGETVSFPGPDGDVAVQTLPRPVQSDLPMWVTSAGNVETFREAGRLGANVLTHLLGQTTEEVAAKIEAYRAAWSEAGHAGSGTVTLMLHTFVGDDDDAVRETVREPMKRYLQSSVNLVRNMASAFPTFRPAPDGSNASFDHLTEDEMDALLDFAFERYFETSGLFGSPATCERMLRRLMAIGVNEIACLIDFGVDTDEVLTHLEDLRGVKDRVSSPATGNSLAATFQREGITHFQCTPTMAKMLMLDPAARAALGQLRQMLVGGEALPAALATDLLGALSGRLENMYGPTETTIWSSTSTVVEGEPVTLGRPIANTQFYVLDEEQRAVDDGVPGELWIGGDGVGRGYLHAPELTAERFISNPFLDDPDARMYRTGDLVRWSATDGLEFLGRIDQQVKVRGHRIELGEIEARLVEHPAVQDAVVVAQPDAHGDLRLAAFLIPAGAMPAANDLREHLADRLPAYMMPAHFVPMESFPRTPNNKVDRNALPPAAELALAEERQRSAPPESSAERIVAQAWEELLGIPAVGLDDNFFELGGDSLLIVRLHQRLENVLAGDVPFADLFRFPTVRQFAARVAGEPVAQSAASEGRDRAALRRQVRSRAR